MSVFGFSEGDAKRIGKAVRLVERLPITDTAGPSTPEVSRPVRIMLAQAGNSAWNKLSTHVVTVYSGTPHTATGRPSVNAGTVVAYNIFANLQPTCSGHWVALSNNGWGWYVIAAECV